MIQEDDLIFDQVRSGTPQWEVLANEKVVARVTERVVAKPPYLVVLVQRGQGLFRSSRKR